MSVRKLTSIILLFFIITSLGLQVVKAESPNVLDCIENNEDCIEEEKQVVGEQIESDEIDHPVTADETFNSSSFMINIIKIIVALLFTLGLLYVVVLLLRRRHGLSQQNDILENLGGIPLGPNRSAQLIRVGSRIYLVGVGENIELMLEVEEEDVVTTLLKQQDELKEQKTIFDQILLKKKNQTKQKNDSTKDFIDELQKELSSLETKRNKLMDDKLKKDDEYE